MNASAATLQTAYVIRHRKYSETSLIIDFFTREHGIVSVLAKGALRKKSKLTGVLLPFSQLKISFSGRSALKTLITAELLNLAKLTGIHLYCGFYINELIALFVHPEDANPEIFDCYKKCLNELGHTPSIEQLLRFFEMDLLHYSGYTGEWVDGLGQHSSNAETYLYSYNEGIVANAKGYICGSTLTKLYTRQVLSCEELQECKVFTRHMLDTLLQGKEIKSRKVLANMIKYLE